MSAFIVRPEETQDSVAIRSLLVLAFGNEGEAKLVDALRSAGDVALSLVAERDGEVRGHILFSRIIVRQEVVRFPAVALAPLAVHPDHRHEGIGSALVEEGHLHLRQRDERLSVVLGDPAYYGRFGYTHERAKDFESAYQGDALQALAWGEAPYDGVLEYPAAFADLG